MRFFLLMAFFGAAAVVLESTWLSDFPTQSLRIDFVVIAVAALAFSFEWRQALPLVILYGVLMDVASAAPFGMSIFSYVIIYGFLRTIIAKISFQAGPALLFWVAIVSLLDKALCSLVLIAATGDLAIPQIIVRVAPAQAFIDAVAGLAMVPFLGWYWDLSWEKITRPKGLVMR
jgi:hypothetical protein